MTDAQVFRFILEDGGGSSSASSADSSRGDTAGASPSPTSAPPDRPVKPGQIPPPDGRTSSARKPGSTPDVVPGQIDRLIKDLLQGFESLPIFGAWIRAAHGMVGPLLRNAAVSEALRSSLHGLLTGVRPGQVQDAAKPSPPPSATPKVGKGDGSAPDAARPAPTGETKPGQVQPPQTGPVAAPPAGEQPQQRVAPESPQSGTNVAPATPQSAAQPQKQSPATPPQPTSVIPPVRPGQIGAPQPVMVKVDVPAGEQKPVTTPAPSGEQPIVPQNATSPGKTPPVVAGQTPPPVTTRPSPSIAPPQAVKPPAVHVADRAFDVQQRSDQPGVWQALDRLGQAMRDFSGSDAEGQARNYAWGQRKTLEAKHGESLDRLKEQTRKFAEVQQAQQRQPVAPGQIGQPDTSPAMAPISPQSVQPVAAPMAPPAATSQQQPSTPATQPQPQVPPAAARERPVIAGAVVEAMRQPSTAQRPLMDPVKPGQVSGPDVGPAGRLWHKITNQVVWRGDRAIRGSRRAVAGKVGRLMQSKAFRRAAVRMRGIGQRAGQMFKPITQAAGQAARGTIGRLGAVVTVARAGVAGIGAAGAGAGAAAGGTAAGGAVAGAPLAAGAIGILGPLGIAVAGVTVAMLGLTVAAKKLDHHFREQADRLSPFSPALQLSRARNQIAQQQQDIGAARRLGPGLAKFEDSRADIGRTLQRIEDHITGGLLEIVNEPVRLLANIIKIIERITPALSAVPTAAGIIVGPALKEINDLLEKIAGGQERLAGANDVLGIFGQETPPPLPVNFGGKTYPDGKGPSIGGANVKFPQPGLGL